MFRGEVKTKAMVVNILKSRSLALLYPNAAAAAAATAATTGDDVDAVMVRVGGRCPSEEP